MVWESVQVMWKRSRHARLRDISGVILRNRRARRLMRSVHGTPEVYDSACISLTRWMITVILISISRKYHNCFRFARSVEHALAYSSANVRDIVQNLNTFCCIRYTLFSAVVHWCASWSDVELNAVVSFVVS